MIAYHGSPRRFARFDPAFIGSGDGLACRGHGFNVTLDFAVAAYYATQARDEAFVYQVSVPEKDELLCLDAPIDSAPALVAALHRALGIDPEAVFDAAAEDEAISMSYPDERALAMLGRVLVSRTDESAWGELAEWSPGYDWAALRATLERHAIDFDAECNTLGELCAAALERLGSPGAVNAWLGAAGYRGTYGDEPLSEDPDRAVSAVIFDAGDITIVRRHAASAEAALSP
ncbi:hypothetical protein J2T57_001655 [Natronocella acetinitrilica]|uniref:Uncharacterized protein n=1 Tax=Natronocella acetinitrilica TaxID=414046 RepID=A0AAE3KC59_9GAMM|nr:hypothetical protein [Natronocella acetinitrilica]MCP1674553.1 hypothetical protein [Natronocella acetinitrilica]